MVAKNKKFIVAAGFLFLLALMGRMVPTRHQDTCEATGAHCFSAPPIIIDYNKLSR